MFRSLSGANRSLNSDNGRKPGDLIVGVYAWWLAIKLGACSHVIGTHLIINVEGFDYTGFIRHPG